MKGNMKYHLSAFVLFLVLSHVVEAQNVASIIDSASNKEAFWSVTVRDEDGKILESLNSGKMIIPASNQKLYTTAAVLNALGSDFRYATKIYGKGEQTGSKWDGDIIVYGAGDPSISGLLYNEDRLYVFKEFVQQLEQKGIKEITGNILGNVSYFDRDYYPIGWGWYDMSFYYGVQISPLSFNNNAVDLEVFAEGRTGDKPRIDWFPKYGDYVEFINGQLITPKETTYEEYYRRGLGSNTIMLASTLPEGYYETETLSVNDPELFFLTALKGFLEEQGIKFTGPAKTVIDTQPFSPDSGKLIVLAEHYSKPLAELVQWTNKESDNFFTEMFLKTLAAEKQGLPGSFENGIKEVRSFLSELGLDTTYVVMNDGSGLASGNFTTTANISALLVFMQYNPEFKPFYESLSVTGIDGSLKNRMKDTPLFNNFRGKTGYVSGARTLSGYIKAKSGKTLILSLATNHFAGKVKTVNETHEQILEYLYYTY